MKNRTLVLLTLALLVGVVNIALRVAWPDTGRMRARAAIADTLCRMVEHRRQENIEILRGPDTALRSELVHTIGDDRIYDGADALTMCTTINLAKLVQCRLDSGASCMADVLENAKER